ncbi:hypothetical protein [Lutibacter sp.]|uniref:TlpA family protein disulfide reductase n=1 Tax=Lutibacter sp. TaxID=1925666 RepID=UPI001A2905DE|nr:hypothetical protein [Lutibacter sp.]MBI9041469.1 hypothetical protein [Lutibacter sp.]
MKYIIHTIVTLFLISCNTTSTKDKSTYFGGEIVNPKDSFVVLLKDDKIIDTLQLDKQNRFISNYKNLDEGLYTFKHGIEFQYVYIEPKDSILLRLNSWDFDESIVFSGNGGSKNEFLINLFLQNEKEEKAMYQYFSLNETDFTAKIDSLMTEREAIYEEFSKAEDNVSSGFKKLTKSAIHFPLYRLKEIYPYFHKKALNLDKFPVLNEDFYNYRKDIDFNQADLISFYPYQNYVVSYLYNLSYDLIEKDSTKNNLTMNILNAIDENIQLDEFKNTLLKRVVVNDFLKSESSCTIHEPTLKLFLEKCTNEEYKTQVKNLVNDSKAVENSKPLISFNIQSSTKELVDINTVIKGKNAVIYFWTTEFMSTEYLVNRIKYLKNKYPDILFIGINMQTTFREIKTEPHLKKLDIQQQYKLPKTSAAYSFLTSYYPRVIIVGDDGIVKNGFTYLDSKKLNSELTKLELN